VQDVAKVIRRAASVLGTSAAIAHRTQVLLFGEGDRLLAIAIVQQSHDQRTADLVVLAVHEDVQGAWLRERVPRPLCVAVLEETAHLASRQGYERMLAIVAKKNEKSVRLITRAGFTHVTLLDGDYALYQATVPRGVQPGQPDDPESS
jgi:L-amino acid N-acyltransferase YncA